MFIMSDSNAPLSSGHRGRVRPIMEGMQTQILSSLESAVVEVVRQAMQICRSVQDQLVAGQTLEKNDRSPVTVADYASQIILIHGLRTLTPEMPVTAEEDAGDLRKPENRDLLDQVLSFCRRVHPDLTADAALDLLDAGNHPGGPDQPFWTLDPIDGTKGFLRGDQYAVALAGLQDGQVVTAYLGCPNLGEPNASKGLGRLFTAHVEEGARVRAQSDFEHPKAIAVDRTNDPAAWRFCEPFESGHSAHDQSSAVVDHLGITRDPVRMDSQCKYAVVAAGLSHAYLRLPTRPGYEEKIWDHAAGSLIVEEAGGIVSDVDCLPLDFTRGPTLKNNRGVVADCGLFHDDLVQAIQRTANR